MKKTIAVEWTPSLRLLLSFHQFDKQKVGNSSSKLSKTFSPFAFTVVLAFTACLALREMVENFHKSLFWHLLKSCFILTTYSLKEWWRLEKERGDQRWKSYSTTTTSTTYYVLLLPTSKLHLKSWEEKKEQGGTKGKKLDSNWEEISEGIERKH